MNGAETRCMYCGRMTEGKYLLCDLCYEAEVVAMEETSPPKEPQI